MDLTTQATDDYLKVIYELVASQGRATTGAIAERLAVAPASATGMVQKLASAEPPLVRYRKRWGAVLTPAGEQQALQTIRQHRLLETFLHEALGYEWDEVHEEAERLEHAISAALEARIDQILDYPAHDPHGDPIPTRELEVAARVTLPLAEVAPGQAVTVCRVGDQEPAVLRKLAEMKLRPGVQIEVEDGCPLQITVAGESFSLPAEMGDQIFVSENVTEAVADEAPHERPARVGDR